MHVRSLLKDGLSTYTRRIHLDARVIYVSGPTMWAKHFRSRKLSVSPRVVNLTWRTYRYARRRMHGESTHKCLFSVLSRSSVNYKSMPRYSGNVDAFLYFRATTLFDYIMFDYIMDYAEREYLHTTIILSRLNLLKIHRNRSWFIAHLNLKENLVSLLTCL